MSGLDIANVRIHKEEELSETEEAILEEHTMRSGKNYLKAAEDAIEANDNNFDGLINAVPGDGEDDPDDDYSSELSVKRAREYDAARQKAVEDEEIAKERKRNARARAQSYREIDR